MQLRQPTEQRQSGFSAIELLLVALTIAALVLIGFVVYQRHKPSSAKNSAASNTSLPTGQKQSTPGAQPQPTTYLEIKEWGIKLPLSDTIKDAYYSFKGSNCHSSDILAHFCQITCQRLA